VQRVVVVSFRFVSEPFEEEAVNCTTTSFSSSSFSAAKEDFSRLLSPYFRRIKSLLNFCKRF
jgi:hypothetical protein